MNRLIKLLNVIIQPKVIEKNFPVEAGIFEDPERNIAGLAIVQVVATKRETINRNENEQKGKTKRQSKVI